MSTIPTWTPDEDRELTQLVLNNLSHPTYWKDSSGQFRGCNAAFAKAVGLSHSQEIVGKGNADLPPLIGFDFLGDRDAIVLAQGTSENHTLQVEQNGSTVWLDIRKIPLCSDNSSDRPSGLLCTIEDITTQKAVEQQLQHLNEALEDRVQNRTSELAEAIVRLETEMLEREQVEALLHSNESYHRHLFEMSPIGLALRTVNGTLIDVNPAYAAILGRTVSETLNLSTWDLTPAEYAPFEQELIQNLYRVGHYGPYEKKYIHKDGSLVSVRLSSILVDREGEPYVWSIVEDISQRVEAETALRQSQQRISLLVQQTPLAVIEWNTNWEIIDWNPAAEKMFGYRRDAAIGQPASFLIPPEVRQAVDIVLEQTLGDHNNTHSINDNITADGRRITCEWYNTILHDEAGEVVGVASLVQDISDRRAAELKLHASQQLLRQVIDNIPQATFWKNCHSVYLGCNRNFAKDAGLHSPSEIIGKTDFDLAWTRAEAEWYRECDEQVMASNTPWLHVIEAQHRSDGQKVWLDTNRIPLRDAEGTVIGILGTYEDISERKKAEEALRDSEQQLREQAERERILNRLIRKINHTLDFDTILLTTLQELRRFLQIDHCVFAWYRNNVEHPYWEITAEACEANQTELKGRYSEEVIADLAERLFEQETIQISDIHGSTDQTCQQLAQAIGFRATLIVPLQMPSNTVGVLAAINYNNPHDWRDREIKLVQTVMEQLAIALNQAELYNQARSKAQELETLLREYQRTQAQMVQSEKMSSLGQLVAGIAHEINNPVNFIYGNLNYARDYTHDLMSLIQLYQKHYPSPHAEIQAQANAVDLEFLLTDLPKILNSMRTGAERIQKIVLSLRNFSRMDEAEQKAVDIHEGIESTLMILQNRFKSSITKTSITITQEFGQLPPVDCYAGQLNQVFMNLISNAIDALEETNIENPEIRIKTDYLADNWIQIRIADNGPGITPEQKNRLFDPFFTTKPIGKGTGLGLSISYQIVVEKHNGRLYCESQLGRGTEFIIEIPAN